MAVYRGKVDIVNMSNITATAGVGIQSSRTLYVISNSGNVPPDLVDVSLTTIDGNTLTFASTGATFKVVNNILMAWQGEQEVPLTVDANKVLVGVEGWVPEVPEVGAGQYLWSKTIYTYTNGTQTITYGVFRQGADGKEGPQGPAGVTAASYRLNCNQSEILKFVDNSGNTTISPEVLTVSVVKGDPTSDIGYVQIVDLDINKFVVEVYNINTGAWLPISGSDIIYLDETYNFNIDLSALLESNVEEDNLAATQLLFNECILKLSYSHQEEVEGETQKYGLVEFLNVRYGMNKDMAQLSIKANGIVASMQDSKMIFNSSGLTVQNGSFTITDEYENKLLYADENGNLALKGNIYADSGYFSGELSGATGTFSGELTAATGSFAGDISAATGTFSGNITAGGGRIGGFDISQTQLTSIGLNEAGAPSIILNGTEGSIEANKITLGTGARIKEYIKIGENVELRNAANIADSFITVNNTEGAEILAMKANGTIKVGTGENSILINGADGSIVSYSYANGLGWKISNTESIFNDVTVRGSIRASVLEYGETQAIGGALLVRPSSRIKKVEINGENTKLTLEETRGFKVNDFCRIDSQNQNGIKHDFYQIISVEDKIITVDGDATGSEGKPIVNFGQTSDNKDYNDNVGISINGSTDNSFSTPQSISVFDFNPETKIITPRVVLGKLPNEESIYGYAAGSYGLYAENVLLKGSLVTQTDTTGSITYSGISTLYSGADAPTSQNYSQWFDQTGEILLWAGALGTSKKEVEESKFFVDRHGNLFAGSGYFKGTIITDATITASAIETATLRGSNDRPGEPALNIEDATKGIVFTATEGEGDSKETKVVFEVTKDSITANVPNFTFNSNFTVGGNGSLVVPNLYVIGDDSGKIIADGESSQKAIVFDKHKISYVNNFNQNELTGSINGYIDFDSILALSPDGVTEVLKLSGQEVRATTPLYLEDSIKYNELMEYKPVYGENEVLIGYDLYIE